MIVGRPLATRQELWVTGSLWQAQLAQSSHTLELNEQSLVRIPTSVDPLEVVAEANHDTPVLKQVAQERCRWVARIAGGWELHDHAIEERDDDLIIGLRVIDTTGEKRGQ